MNIKLFCTDRHSAIRKMIREEFPGIIHEFDVWHLAKSVGKKILAASKKRNCSSLAAWVSPIKNHIWWCASTCDEDEDLLITKWNSLLYHVANRIVTIPIKNVCMMT